MSNTSSIMQEGTLAAGFAAHAQAGPGNPALYIGDHLYSYGGLKQRAETVFAQLNKHKLPALIGVYTEDSVWTYAAILAVSLSGACYVPLNPKLPAARLQAIMKACGMELVIGLTPLPFEHQAEELIIDTVSMESRPCEMLMRQDLAYLMFTSGTTGAPKGVPVSKSNVHSFFKHYREHFDFNARDRFLQPYELSFDVSVFSIFVAWNAGASVYCVPGEGPKYLAVADMLSRHEITVSSLVPTALFYLEKYLPALSFPKLRHSFFSGDKLYHRLALLWAEAAPQTEITNCYGPTETTVVCTSYPWSAAVAARAAVHGIVPLGKPFEGMVYELLNEQGDIVAEGIGELCLSGPQAITGYLNGSLAERFISLGARSYYRTGDLAAVDQQGDLIFHGRVDSQVKVNGYRVELAEVEHALQLVTNKPVSVQALEEHGMTLLCAFVEGAELKITEWKTALTKLLPDYMIPARYRIVNELPRNSNGKLDATLLKTSE